MPIRLSLFVGWAILGVVFSYGALYAFSPYGVVLLALGTLVAWQLPNRAPEAWGLLAGPGILCALIARNTNEDPTGWAVASAVLIGLSVLAFAISGRARCAGS